MTYNNIISHNTIITTDRGNSTWSRRSISDSVTLLAFQ